MLKGLKGGSCKWHPPHHHLRPHEVCAAYPATAARWHPFRHAGCQGLNSGVVLRSRLHASVQCCCAPAAALRRSAGANMPHTDWSAEDMRINR